MKIALIALLAFSGFAGPVDSGLYSYTPNGTNDVAGMIEHIQELRRLIECNDKIEASLILKIEAQKRKLESLECLIEKMEPKSNPEDSFAILEKLFQVKQLGQIMVDRNQKPFTGLTRYAGELQMFRDGILVETPLCVKTHMDLGEFMSVCEIETKETIESMKPFSGVITNDHVVLTIDGGIIIQQEQSK